MAEQDELSAIHQRYARRTRIYEPWDPWVWRTHRGLELAMIRMLGRKGFLPARDTRILEIGCGSGTNLQTFLRLGFQPANLAGIELQEARLAAARDTLPRSVQLWCGDAATLEIPPSSFDIVFQSLVFSSILDDSLQALIAQRMVASVKPGGGILWYDFMYDNPQNPDVRGVKLSRIRALFPDQYIHMRRVTLAPPIARLVASVWPPLYDLCDVVPLLRTHCLCWIAGENNK